MGFKSFEDIGVWQKAKQVSLNLYKIFGQSTDYGFRDQILRASVSVMNNIAEGFERQSRVEFRRFLYIAKGSAGEVRSMLVLAHELNRMSEKDSIENIALCSEVSRMISGLIKTL